MHSYLRIYSHTFAYMYMRTLIFVHKYDYVRLFTTNYYKYVVFATYKDVVEHQSYLVSWDFV